MTGMGALGTLHGSDIAPQPGASREVGQNGSPLTRPLPAPLPARCVPREQARPSQRVCFCVGADALAMRRRRLARARGAVGAGRERMSSPSPAAEEVPANRLGRISLSYCLAAISGTARG